MMEGAQAKFGEMSKIEAIQIKIDQTQAAHALRDEEMSANQEKMNNYLEALMAEFKQTTYDTSPPAATPTKRSAPATDEDDEAADATWKCKCVDALPETPLPITCMKFNGDCRAVAAQVQIVLNAFGLAAPHHRARGRDDTTCLSIQLGFAPPACFCFFAPASRTPLWCGQRPRRARSA